jgi:hypothetical protein
MQCFSAGRALVAIALTTAALAATPVAAWAASPCTGTVTSVVAGSLVVPSGATCTLARATILGGVRMQGNSALQSVGSSINGRITCRGMVVPTPIASFWRVECPPAPPVPGGDGNDDLCDQLVAAGVPHQFCPFIHAPAQPHTPQPDDDFPFFDFDR